MNKKLIICFVSACLCFVSALFLFTINDSLRGENKTLKEKTILLEFKLSMDSIVYKTK